MGTWTDAQLVKAIAAVDARSNITTVARVFGIPPSSLRDHMNGRTVQRNKGRQGVLTKDEESALVQWILQMQEHAHPISILKLKNKVTKITQERWTPFKEGIPGQGWFRWFCHRHPELTLRTT